MNFRWSNICILQILAILHIDGLKLVPADRTVIKQNGTTRTISRFLVLPQNEEEKPVKLDETLSNENNFSKFLRAFRPKKNVIKIKRESSPKNKKPHERYRIFIKRKLRKPKYKKKTVKTIPKYRQPVTPKNSNEPMTKKILKKRILRPATTTTAATYYEEPEEDYTQNENERLPKENKQTEIPDGTEAPEELETPKDGESSKEQILRSNESNLHAGEDGSKDQNTEQNSSKTKPTLQPKGNTETTIKQKEEEYITTSSAYSTDEVQEETDTEDSLDKYTDKPVTEDNTPNTTKSKSNDDDNIFKESTRTEDSTANTESATIEDKYPLPDSKEMEIKNKLALPRLKESAEGSEANLATASSRSEGLSQENIEYTEKLRKLEVENNETINSTPRYPDITGTVEDIRTRLAMPTILSTILTDDEYSTKNNRQLYNTNESRGPEYLTARMNFSSADYSQDRANANNVNNTSYPGDNNRPEYDVNSNGMKAFKPYYKLPLSQTANNNQQDFKYYPYQVKSNFNSNLSPQSYKQDGNPFYPAYYQEFDQNMKRPGYDRFTGGTGQSTAISKPPFLGLEYGQYPSDQVYDQLTTKYFNTSKNAPYETYQENDEDTESATPTYGFSKKTVEDPQAASYIKYADFIKLLPQKHGQQSKSISNMKDLLYGNYSHPNIDYSEIIQRPIDIAYYQQHSKHNKDSLNNDNPLLNYYEYQNGEPIKFDFKTIYPSIKLNNSQGKIIYHDNIYLPEHNRIQNEYIINTLSRPYTTDHPSQNREYNENSRTPPQYTDNPSNLDGLQQKSGECAVTTNSPILDMHYQSPSPEYIVDAISQPTVVDEENKDNSINSRYSPISNTENQLVVENDEFPNGLPFVTDDNELDWRKLRKICATGHQSTTKLGVSVYQKEMNQIINFACICPECLKNVKFDVSHQQSGGEKQPLSLLEMFKNSYSQKNQANKFHINLDQPTYSTQNVLELISTYHQPHSVYVNPHKDDNDQLLIKNDAELINPLENQYYRPQSIYLNPQNDQNLYKDLQLIIKDDADPSFINSKETYIPSIQIFSRENLKHILAAFQRMKQSDIDLETANLYRIIKLIFETAQRQTPSTDVDNDAWFMGLTSVIDNPINNYVYYLLQQRWLQEIMFQLTRNNYNLNVIRNPRWAAYLGAWQLPMGLLKPNVQYTNHDQMFQKFHKAHTYGGELYKHLAAINLRGDADAILALIQNYLLHAQLYGIGSEEYYQKQNEILTRISIFLRQRGYPLYVIRLLLRDLYAILNSNRPEMVTNVSRPPCYSC